MHQLAFDGWPKSGCISDAAPPPPVDVLLQDVIAEARAIGIPVSSSIFPQVVVNKRAKARFGCCRKKDGRFVIELSARLLNSTIDAQKKTLAHEVLHTCYGCSNHGARWSAYAKRMNSAYGYTIARVDSNESLGISVEETPKYIVQCKICGKEFPRQRASNLTKHPGRYRCKCGGSLFLK